MAEEEEYDGFGDDAGDAPKAVRLAGKRLCLGGSKCSFSFLQYFAFFDEGKVYIAYSVPLPTRDAPVLYRVHMLTQGYMHAVPFASAAK